MKKPLRIFKYGTNKDYSETFIPKKHNPDRHLFIEKRQCKECGVIFEILDMDNRIYRCMECTGNKVFKRKTKEKLGEYLDYFEKELPKKCAVCKHNNICNPYTELTFCELT